MLPVLVEHICGIQASAHLHGIQQHTTDLYRHPPFSQMLFIVGTLWPSPMILAIVFLYASIVRIKPREGAGMRVTGLTRSPFKPTNALTPASWMTAISEPSTTTLSGGLGQRRKAMSSTKVCRRQKAHKAVRTMHRVGNSP